MIVSMNLCFIGEQNGTIEHALGTWNLTSGAVPPSIMSRGWVLRHLTLSLLVPRTFQDTSWLPPPTFCPSREPEPGPWRVGARHALLVASCSRYNPQRVFNTTVVWWVTSQRPWDKEVKVNPGSQCMLAWRSKCSRGSPVCSGLGLMPESAFPDLPGQGTWWRACELLCSPHW